MPTVNGERLAVLRELNGTPREQIAADLHVTSHHLRLIERGERSPSVDLLRALAAYFAVPESFFARRSLTDLPLDHCSFRSQRVAAKRFRATFVARAALLSELAEWFATTGVRMPASRLPAIPDESPETAARVTREALGVGQDRPISNLVLAAETAGILLADIDQSETTIDAMSCWTDRPVAIRSNAKGSTSRARFDLAHEIGHLVMHRSTLGSDQAEMEANEFASALLFPPAALRSEFPRTERWTWGELLDLKRRWGLSLAAILNAAKRAELIGEVRYRSAFVYMSGLGWRREEPEEPPLESPALVATVIQRFAERGRSLDGLLREIGWSADLFEQVTGVPAAPARPTLVADAGLAITPLRRAAGEGGS